MDSSKNIKDEPLIDKKYIPFLILFITALFLWKMIVYGYIPLANDMVAHEPIKKWIATTSEFPHWFPNLFSGLPSYGGYIYTPGDPIKPILDIILFNKGVKIWFYFTLGGLGLFYFLRFLGKSIFPALFGGISYALTPYGFGLINAGHNNKIMAMAFIPWILFAIMYTSRTRSLRSILFLSILTALQLWANHPQIVYYTWMMVGVWWLWSICFDLKDKTFSLYRTGSSLGLISSGLFLAFLMVSDPYIDVYTFQKYSNRGAPSVTDKTDDTRTGTKWDYATQWSFHPKETISFLYPYHYGLQNFPAKDMSAAAYWGYMPFTQSTHYLGLIVILLAVLGSLLRKPDRYELFFWLTSFLVLLIGFGSHFPVLYKPLFAIAPFFSKFRIPSMIYILLAVTIPCLAASGMDLLIEKGRQKETLIKCQWFFGSFIGLTLLLFLFGESLLSFSSIGDSRFNPALISKVQDIRIDLFHKGLLLALTIVGAGFGLVWAYTKGHLNAWVFSVMIIMLSLVDLWTVNQEFLKLKPAKNMGAQFRMDPVISYLLEDKGHYRIFPADELSSNRYGYWGIESIGGYRAVKLRHYQDLMDAGGFGRPAILSMLNVKYLITGKKVRNTSFIPAPNFKGIYENKDVMPRAWLVGNVESVTDQKASLSKIISKSFRPQRMAVVVNYTGPDLPGTVQGTATIRTLTENEILIDVQTDSSALLVLSEVYYAPGWKCDINGEPTKIFQTDHVLRSIYIPKGQHEVRFYYDHGSWKIARIVSRSSFLFLVCALFFLSWKDNKRVEI